MELNPRYGSSPVIQLACAPDAARDVTIRQHRRLAATVALFNDAEWQHASRCDGWSNRDVIAHLEGTNRYWEFSIQMGLAGTPSKVLAAFDPVATPAELVAAESGRSAAEVCDRFMASTESFCNLLESLDSDGWSTLAEAPPGHQSVGAVVHHAHWDAWVHERDILQPLGRAPEATRDEALTALRYVLALGPALATNAGAASPGTLRAELTDGPEVFQVHASDSVRVTDTGVAETMTELSATIGDDNADVVLRGTAVDLVEELSLRVPLTQPLSPRSQWFVGALAPS